MLIDSHCHVPHPKYKKSAKDVVNEAVEAGVTKLINIGTSLEANAEALKVSSEFENVYSAIAIYPHDDMDKSVDFLQTELEKQILSSKKVVAVGECGIDLSEWQGGRFIDDQIALFEMQLGLAQKHKLPIAIHNRNGDDKIMQILDKFDVIGVAHCFASNWEVAQQYLDRGYYLSFSGMITYKARKELHEVVQKVPLDRFLVETDAPYLPPEGFRGQPNEPKLVVEVAKKFAEIRNTEFDKIADLSYSNTCELFKV